MITRNQVAVNYKLLSIDESSVSVRDASSGSSISITGHEYDLERESYVLHLAEDLAEGATYSLSLEEP